MAETLGLHMLIFIIYKWMHWSGFHLVPPCGLDTFIILEYCNARLCGDLVNISMAFMDIITGTCWLTTWAIKLSHGKQCLSVINFVYEYYKNGHQMAYRCIIQRYDINLTLHQVESGTCDLLYMSTLFLCHPKLSLIFTCKFNEILSTRSATLYWHWHW